MESDAWGQHIVKSVLIVIKRLIPNSFMDEQNIETKLLTGECIDVPACFNKHGGDVMVKYKGKTYKVKITEVIDPVKERIRGIIVRHTSEMFDNVGDGGIYPTGRFYDDVVDDVAAMVVNDADALHRAIKGLRILTDCLTHAKMSSFGISKHDGIEAAITQVGFIIRDLLKI